MTRDEMETDHRNSLAMCRRTERNLVWVAFGFSTVSLAIALAMVLL